MVSPEDAGLTRAPLERFRNFVQKEVHKVGSQPGSAHLAIVNGKCVFAHADGLANVKSGEKFKLNTLVALHSCTKPIVVASFLTLLDKGKVRLSDYIDKYVPYSELVASSTSPSGTSKRKTRPTLHHLVTQVAGLRHSDEDAYKSIISKLDKNKIINIAGMIDALADIPLQSEPGTLHYYSWSIDVLGRIIEVVSGKKLDKFVSEAILQPLGMKDTHFRIPSSKLGRKSNIYWCKNVRSQKEAKKSGGKKRPYEAQLWSGEKMNPGVFSSGGGILSYSDAGLYGTAEDYARFCLMLVNEGVAPGGRRILRQKTARMLFQDCLTPFGSKKDGRVPGWNDYEGDDAKATYYWDRHAWSLLNATLDLEGPPKKSGSPRQGNTLWMYGMGAYWLVDKKRKLVAVSMTQCFSCRKSDRGSDCVPYLRQAIEEGSAKLKASKSEVYYGKEEWKSCVGLSKLTAAEMALGVRK